MLYLLVGFLLGLAVTAFWRFLGECLAGWMDDTVPDAREPTAQPPRGPRRAPPAHP